MSSSFEDRLKSVQEEVSRLQQRMLEYQLAYPGQTPKLYHGCKYRAAIKRASMDVSRALAELRK